MRALLLFVILGTLASCARPYKSHDFADLTRSHRTVAIIPFDIIFTGRYPDDMTDEQIAQQLGVESMDFQLSFYQSVYNSARRKKDALTVNIQDIRKTNSLLREAGYDPAYAYEQDAQELAQILDVDAVLRGTIEKNRLMSDELSVGIDIAATVLGGALGDVAALTPTLSKRVRASYDIIDRWTGTVLWSLTSNDEANWQQTATDLMNEINLGAAKRFPYRERDR
jgi:hypothetical protein